MVAEMKWIVADGVNPDPLLDYSHNFVFSSFSPSQHETIWWMGLLAIATILMCIPAVVTVMKKLRVETSTIIAFDLRTTHLLGLDEHGDQQAFVADDSLSAHGPASVSMAGGNFCDCARPDVQRGSFWRERLRDRYRPVALAMCGVVLIAITFSLTQTVRGAIYLSKSRFDQNRGAASGSAGHCPMATHLGQCLSREQAVI